MRSAEDLGQEVTQLRNDCRKYSEQNRELRAERDKALKELEWWKKTFGPESGR